MMEQPHKIKTKIKKSITKIEQVNTFKTVKRSDKSQERPELIIHIELGENHGVEQHETISLHIQTVSTEILPPFRIFTRCFFGHILKASFCQSI